MKIVAPIRSPEEVAVLAGAGADEFYCGLLPSAWRARVHQTPLSRRAGGNFTDLATLAEAAARAHDLGRTLAMAFNSQNYPGARWHELLELIEASVRAGADALIVADLGLLAELARRKLPARVHLSSVASCHNTEAAALAGELGAARVILPRHVTVAETRGICAALPDVEIESFVLNDGCVFEEGSCHTLHLPGRLGGPICLDCRRYDYERDGGAPPDAAELQALQHNDAAWDEWLWYTFSCGFTVTEAGLPFGPCGLCAIPALGAAGVAALKIAGREAPLERRRKSVQMVASVRAQHSAGSAASDVHSFARGLRGKPALCDNGYMCYYRPSAATRRAP